MTVMSGGQLHQQFVILYYSLMVHLFQCNSQLTYQIDIIVCICHGRTASVTKTKYCSGSCVVIWIPAIHGLQWIMSGVWRNDSEIDQGKDFSIDMNLMEILFYTHPYSISQEICTQFLLCYALLWLYIDWFSHIHQAYFTGTVAI